MEKKIISNSQLITILENQIKNSESDQSSDRSKDLELCMDLKKSYEKSGQKDLVEAMKKKIANIIVNRNFTKGNFYKNSLN